MRAVDAARGHGNGGAIIHMASSLGLQAIAKGVETTGPLTFPHQQGCDEVQGYYFSRPLPAEQFEQFVRSKAWLDSMRWLSQGPSSAVCRALRPRSPNGRENRWQRGL